MNKIKREERENLHTFSDTTFETDRYLRRMLQISETNVTDI